MDVAPHLRPAEILNWLVITYSNTVSYVGLLRFLGAVQAITPFFWGVTPRQEGSVAAIPVQHSGLSFLDTIEDEATKSCRNIVSKCREPIT
jgi:hypothetical protein